MNEQIRELTRQVYGPSLLDDENFVMNNDKMERFAVEVLKKTFSIIAESMIDTDADLKIDEIIADRLDEAAVDVCCGLDIFDYAIYRY
jgi:hypothetical protein